MGSRRKNRSSLPIRDQSLLPIKDRISKRLRRIVTRIPERQERLEQPEQLVLLQHTLEARQVELVLEQLLELAPHRMDQLQEHRLVLLLQVKSANNCSYETRTRLIEWSYLKPTMILATPIKCWTCRNAYSYAECQSKGYLVTCQSNQESCELEVRERNGNVIQVNTGCKQAMACENNKAQNFQLRFEIFLEI